MNSPRAATVSGAPDHAADRVRPQRCWAERLGADPEIWPSELVQAVALQPLRPAPSGRAWKTQNPTRPALHDKQLGPSAHHGIEKRRDAPADGDQIGGQRKRARGQPHRRDVAQPGIDRWPETDRPPGTWWRRSARREIESPLAARAFGRSTRRPRNDPIEHLPASVPVEVAPVASELEAPDPAGERPTDAGRPEPMAAGVRSPVRVRRERPVDHGPNDARRRRRAHDPLEVAVLCAQQRVPRCASILGPAQVRVAERVTLRPGVRVPRRPNVLSVGPATYPARDRLGGRNRNRRKRNDEGDRDPRYSRAHAGDFPSEM